LHAPPRRGAPSAPRPSRARPGPRAHGEASRRACGAAALPCGPARASRPRAADGRRPPRPAPRPRPPPLSHDIPGYDIPSPDGKPFTKVCIPPGGNYKGKTGGFDAWKQICDDTPGCVAAVAPTAPDGCVYLKTKGTRDVFKADPKWVALTSQEKPSSCAKFANLGEGCTTDIWADAQTCGFCGGGAWALGARAPRVRQPRTRPRRSRLQPVRRGGAHAAARPPARPPLPGPRLRRQPQQVPRRQVRHDLPHARVAAPVALRESVRKVGWRSGGNFSTDKTTQGEREGGGGVLEGEGCGGLCAGGRRGHGEGRAGGPRRRRRRAAQRPHAGGRPVPPALPLAAARPAPVPPLPAPNLHPLYQHPASHDIPGNDIPSGGKSFTQWCTPNSGYYGKIGYDAYQIRCNEVPGCVAVVMSNKEPGCVYLKTKGKRGDMKASDEFAVLTSQEPPQKACTFSANGEGCTTDPWVDQPICGSLWGGLGVAGRGARGGGFVATGARRGLRECGEGAARRAPGPRPPLSPGPLPSPPPGQAAAATTSSAITACASRPSPAAAASRCEPRLPPRAAARGPAADSSAKPLGTAPRQNLRVHRTRFVSAPGRPAPLEPHPLVDEPKRPLPLHSRQVLL
jgi:hypothetical protein